MSQIDTAAAVLHDCRCYIANGGMETRPTAHGFYRGFIWHKWGREGGFCILPVELPLEEAAALISIPGRASHQLSNGETTVCMYPIKRLARVKRIVDSFWENLQRGMSHDPTD
jgi:hypothetical protein